MKSPSDRTKVVLRHLPPAISQVALMEKIDPSFVGRYNWVHFCPGKTSQKNHWHSRAYIDFKMPEDVVRFAELFNGHMFVNEKGAQFKTIVEYAPSQRVPKALFKKDGREGAIFKDPDYLEFLEHLAKPVVNLPSAEIQLERREAERAGRPKETLIVTPLMEYIRQKRAAKSSQRSANGKINRRAGVSSPICSSLPFRRGSENRRGQTSMYVIKDGTKSSNGKDKFTYISMPKGEEQLYLSKSSSIVSANGTHTLEDDKVSGGTETGKRRVLVLEVNEKEISHDSSGSSEHKKVLSSVKASLSSVSLEQSRNDVSGTIIRSILSNKDIRQNQSNSFSSQSEQQIVAPNFEKDKLSLCSPSTRPFPMDLATGSHRHVGRGMPHGFKEFHRYPNFSEGKHSKRGGPSGHGFHERQVWVQKSGSAS